MKIYDIAILWKWTWWLFIADSLKKNSNISICVIWNSYWNSALSPWNIRNQIDDKVLSILNNNSNELYEIRSNFIEKYNISVNEFLNKTNFPLVKTPIWVKLNIKSPWKVILSALESNIKDNVDIIKTNIISIIDNKWFYKIFTCNKTDKFNLFAKKLIIATWWQWNKFDMSTWVRLKSFDVIDMLDNVWVESIWLNEIMYHPFMIKTPWWSFRLISGNLVSSFEYFKVDINWIETMLFPEDIQNHIYNNDYHHIFDRMKHFVLDADKNWNLIIWKNKIWILEYRNLALNNEYWNVIKSFDDEWLKEVIFRPWYHYMLWWVKVNNNLQSTSNKDFYSIWEATGMFFNWNRPAWMGHTDSIVLAPILANIILNS